MSRCCGSGRLTVVACTTWARRPVFFTVTIVLLMTRDPPRRQQQLEQIQRELPQLKRTSGTSLSIAMELIKSVSAAGSAAVITVTGMLVISTLPIVPTT